MFQNWHTWCFWNQEGLKVYWIFHPTGITTLNKIGTFIAGETTNLSALFSCVRSRSAGHKRRWKRKQQLLQDAAFLIILAEMLTIYSNFFDKIVIVEYNTAVLYFIFLLFPLKSFTDDNFCHDKSFCIVEYRLTY